MSETPSQGPPPAAGLRHPIDDEGVRTIPVTVTWRGYRVLQQFKAAWEWYHDRKLSWGKLLVWIASSPEHWPPRAVRTTFKGRIKVK